MPIFGGAKRPALEGLTKDEERRRDALNPEVLRRAGGEIGTVGQQNAALAILREKTDAEPGELLWALLLGRQYMSVRRFSRAIDAFTEALKREDDVRAVYGLGHAYFQAAEAKLNMGDAVTEDIAPADLTVDNLYQEALRHFRRGLEMAAKQERDDFGAAASTVEKAVARKQGRL